MGTKKTSIEQDNRTRIEELNSTNDEFGMMGGAAVGDPSGLSRLSFNNRCLEMDSNGGETGTPLVCFIQVNPYWRNFRLHGQINDEDNHTCLTPSMKLEDHASFTFANRTLGNNRCSKCLQSNLSIIFKSKTTLQMDGYLLSYFVYTLKQSRAYTRSVFLTYFTKSTIVTRSPIDQINGDGNGNGLPAAIQFALQVQIIPCTKHYFDRLGSRIANSFLHERIELDDTLSWLSSLGGAFSALGDISHAWAEQAERITIHQLRIALKMGDPLIISRCHLYAAISLIQRGFYKSARKIILNEYHFAKALPSGTDTRLIKMCHGIWAKLKYMASVFPSAHDKMKKQKVNQTRMNGVQAGNGLLTSPS